MHQAPSSAIDSQKRLISGESQSRLEEDDRRSVDQFGALRVEPGGEAQRVGVVQVDGRVFLGHPRRERHVVPGGVAAEHPLVEVELGREGPLGHREGGDPEGEPEARPSGPPGRSTSRRPAGAIRQPSSAASRPTAMLKKTIQPSRRMLSVPRISSERTSKRDRERRVGEAGQGPREFGDDPAPQPVAAEAESGDDADHGEAAGYVGAEGGCHRRGMLVARAGSELGGASGCCRRRRCRSGRSSRSAPCAGTAGGSPRRSRRARPARSRW